MRYLEEKEARAVPEKNFETIGPFELHPPVGGASGWTMKRDDRWIPLTVDSRDTCLFLAGAYAAGVGDEDVEDLRDLYNRATPSVNVTAQHLLDMLAP